MQTRIMAADQPGAIRQATKLLEDGELVAFPTDTVYGVGAAAFNPEAIDRLFLAKARRRSKAIPVLLGNAATLPQVGLEINSLAQRLADHFWPGALTLIVRRHPALPKNISLSPTIGVRVPDHPTALKLLKQVGPMAVTSANISGEPSTNTAEEVFAQLNGNVPLILDGGSAPGGKPSTVVDCTGTAPTIMRAGPISQAELLAALS